MCLYTVNTNVTLSVENEMKEEKTKKKLIPNYTYTANLKL